MSSLCYSGEQTSHTKDANNQAFICKIIKKTLYSKVKDFFISVISYLTLFQENWSFINYNNKNLELGLANQGREKITALKSLTSKFFIPI